jgi:hypothetical protein
MTLAPYQSAIFSINFSRELGLDQASQNVATPFFPEHFQPSKAADTVPRASLAKMPESFRSQKTLAFHLTPEDWLEGPPREFVAGEAGWTTRP